MPTNEFNWADEFKKHYSNGVWHAKKSFELTMSIKVPEVITYEFFGQCLNQFQKDCTLKRRVLVFLANPDEATEKLLAFNFFQRQMFLNGLI